MKDVTTMAAAATLLLDELARGKQVRLDIQATNAEAAGLTRLILAIHEEAVKRRVAVIIAPAGERAIRLTIGP